MKTKNTHVYYSGDSIRGAGDASLVGCTGNRRSGGPNAKFLDGNVGELPGRTVEPKLGAPL